MTLLEPCTSSAASRSPARGAWREVGALASVAILSGNEWDSSMSVEGHRAADGENMQAFMNSLSPGYFATMQIPLLEGRDFTLSDVKDKATVAIVNRRFAQHFFHGNSAIGKHLGGVSPIHQAHDRNHRRRRRFAL